MKKNVLALSITAAAISLGFAGGAQAITTVGLGSGTSVAVATNGIGHNLVVPYYTAQGANKTQINIVNTDTANGKAVKIRFRTAANSDDVFDFQIFLSPGDVWSGEVSQDTATGKAKIASGDASCTKPSIKTATAANLLFKTDRLDNTSASATDATRAAQTREGYVEILTMADIRPTAYTVLAGAEAAVAAPNTVNALFTAIKHVNGVAPCSGTAFTALDTNLADLSAAAVAGLTRPTGSLLANWTILNTATSAAYGGQATALQITGAAVAAAPVVNTGNLIYWPQSPLGAGTVSQYTADPLLRLVAVGGNPTVAPTMVDLPDLSTPFLGQDAAIATLNQNAVLSGPVNAANQLSAALAKTSVTNEFLTTTAFNASTDWTFSMPTRRYGVVFNYVAGTALFNATSAGAGGVIGDSVTTTGANSNFFQPVNAVVNAARRMVCVNNITPASTDREETTGSTIIFSPAVAPTLCGEVSVLSINNAASATSNSLLAVNTLNDVDATYREGWLSVATPGIAAGLPIIGNAFVRAYTGTINIGAAYTHR